MWDPDGDDLETRAAMARLESALKASAAREDNGVVWET
jgi:hypothetical protein